MMIKKISNKPPRFHENNACYFLTFCTFNRMPILHSKRIPEMVTENLYFYRNRIKELVAYTIMPDHIHLLAEVESSDQLSSFLRDFKTHTSKEIKRLSPEIGAHVWQRGSMDHCTRFSWVKDDFGNHLRYIYYNSYKHLKIKPQDFPYHNFNECVERQMIDPDFCSFDEGTLPYIKIYE